MLPTPRAEWERIERLEHDQLHLPPNPPHCLARCRSEERVIADNAEWLIEHLYYPERDLGAAFSRRYLDDSGRVPNVEALSREPINWGDLGVVEVIRHGEGWQVTLKEAASGRCPALCEYIRIWLHRWGWTPVVVETQW